MRMPEILQRERPNGLTLWAARRPGVPLAAVRIAVLAGAAAEPSERQGLASLTAESLRRGAGKRSAEEIDRAFEALGAELSVEGSSDWAALSYTVPVEGFDASLDLVADIIIAPALERAEVLREKRRIAGELAWALEDAGTAADREALVAAYDAHPYGRPFEGKASGLRRVTDTAVRRFHADAWGPRGALAVVVGDLDPERALDALSARLDRWRDRPSPAKPLPPAPVVPRVLLVDRPDATQTQIRIAFDGIARADAERHAARLANAVLGGSFTSRLMQAIRVDRGLSYGAGSRLASGRVGGRTMLHTFTRTETTREAIDVMLAEARRFAASGPEARELDSVQRFLAGTWPMHVETAEQIARALQDAYVYGLDPSEIATFPDTIRSVERDRVAAQAQRLFGANAFALAVLGKATAVQPLLSGLGPIEQVPLTAL